MHLIWTAVVVVSLSIAASNAHRCLTGGIKSSTSSQMCPSCLPEGTGLCFGKLILSETQINSF